MPLFQQIQYKYQLLIDGNSCSYGRAFWQLFSNSVILKQDSDAIQWYYRALIPYVHYVPIKHDLEDLQSQLAWVLAHDTDAKKISKQAQMFATRNLSNKQILYYTYLLLCAYATLQKF